MRKHLCFDQREARGSKALSDTVPVWGGILVQCIIRDKAHLWSLELETVYYGICLHPEIWVETLSSQKTLATCLIYSKKKKALDIAKSKHQ